MNRYRKLNHTLFHCKQFGLAAFVAMLTLAAYPAFNHGYGRNVDAATAPATAQPSLPTLQGASAVTHLKEQGLYASLQDAMQTMRYAIEPAEKRGGYRAANPAQGLKAEFNKAGLQIADRRSQIEKPQWELGLTLRGVGYGDALTAVSEGTSQSNGNRIEFQKSSILNPQSSITEWYVNRPEGLEQGFTLSAAPGVRVADEPLSLALAVAGDLHPQATDDGSAVHLLHADGTQALRYEHLVVNDATGKQLPAWMRVVENEIRLEVDDRQAVYPVTIDPNFVQTGKLTANDGAAQDYFGSAVAVNGDRAAIGAPGDDIGANSNQGSVYVFVRSGSSWTQEAKLTASEQLRFGSGTDRDSDRQHVGGGRFHR